MASKPASKYDFYGRQASLTLPQASLPNYHLNGQQASLTLWRPASQPQTTTFINGQHAIPASNCDFMASKPAFKYDFNGQQASLKLRLLWPAGQPHTTTVMASQ